MMSDPTAPPAESPRRFARLHAWLQILRIRVAHLVMLPELSPAQARVLRNSVQADGRLTQGYVLMCAISAGIATLGLLQSSTAVVIGAMLVSPLMGPIAALGVGFASLDGHRIRDAARVVVVGAAIGIMTGMLLTWLSPIRNATPEILARTQPTLLDLAVALLSGIAGGYATVMGKGGTAIGVAIATALMPPLATVGYAIGVLQPAFALGAMLLFLTNLSAIAFAFALVARLSGAARPLRRVDLTPGYVAAGLLAFVALATPLAMTLVRVTHEATMHSAARAAILAATNRKRADIAQLEVSWPLFGQPQVNAVVITPVYAAGAPEAAEARLRRATGENVTLNLQQVLAADVPAQTRAMVDAAMERTVAGIAADVPPFAAIRARIGLPTRGIWTNRAERIVNVEPIAAPGWSLSDYRDAEQLADQDAQNWTVHILPPISAQLRVRLDGAPPRPGEVTPQVAAWALQRWGMADVRLDLPAGQSADSLQKPFSDAGIEMEPVSPPATAPAAADARAPARGQARSPAQDNGVAVVEVFSPRPADRVSMPAPPQAGATDQP